MTRNWTKVFAFTFKRHALSRGYRITTVLVALILMLGIAGAMVFADQAKDEKAAATGITRAAYVDDNDLSLLAGIEAGIYGGIQYEKAASLEDAEAMCADDPKSVIVLRDGGAVSVLLPGGTEIGASDAAAFGEFLAAYYPYLAAMRAGADLAKPAYAASAVDAAPQDAGEQVRAIVGMVFPYVALMLLYFMVLIYGQGIANSVIVEKTSRLMDLFLVSIKPSAVILGKTLAIALAGVVQLCAWFAGVWAGCALGAFAVRAINPNSTLGILAFFDMLGSLSGLFSPAGVAVAAAVIVAGFLLYCALSSIGGAMAGKPEDLSVTNFLFTVALVASFFACLFTSETTGMISTSAWLAYVPFTGILVVPGRVLMGEMTVLQGMGSFGIIALTALVIILLAGKAYTAMAFYRGSVPTPKAILRMLRSRKA